MMKYVMVLVILLMPVTAAAQNASTGAVPEGIVVSAPAPGSGVLLLADSAAQAPTPAARSGSEPRRRPSMVGYVGDSTIGSQVRVRFDAGRNLVAADRAEFFYGKCGCYRGLPKTHPFYDANAPGPGSSQFAWLEGLNFEQLYILGEYAVKDRVSLFAEMPVRWISPLRFNAAGGTFGNQSGASDLRAGVKLSAMSTDRRQVTVSVMVTAPTGDAAKGLGTDHASVEPVLLYSEQMDKFGIEAQFGDVIATGGSAGLPTSGSDKFAGNVLYYGFGPSFDVYNKGGVRFAPVIELVGWHLLGGFETLDTSSVKGMNIVNLKVGARVVMANKSSIYIGYGKALTDNTWYDKIVRAEYRVGF